MIRAPLLSILLSLAIFGGFLLLFPADMVLLLAALLGLVVVQAVLLRRHLFPLTAGRGEIAGVPESSAVDANSGREEESEPQSEHAPADGAAAALDPALFSRFRAHLENAEGALDESREPQPPVPESSPEVEYDEQASAPEAAAPPAQESPPIDERETAAPDAGETAVDRVVLSTVARNRPPAKAMPLEPSADAPAPAAAESDEDLFADLRTPTITVSTKGAPEGRAGEGNEAQSADEEVPSLPSTPSLAPPTPAYGPGSGPPRRASSGADSRKDEGSVLLKMAEDALDKGDRAGAHAGLERAAALYSGLAEGAPARANLLRARLDVMEGNFQEALAEYEQYLAGAPETEEHEQLALLDRLVAPLDGEEAASFRVSMLHKLLATYRQANDRAAMDRLYVAIESAQEDAGDENRLIQYLKNHLEIKKVLADVEGQLDLIDRIGNRYYKLGDTAAAREFYEQGLRLRAETEGAAKQPPAAS